MPLKRKRRSPGPVPGQKFRRHNLPGHGPPTWSWVQTEVFNESEITREYLLATCGFSKRSANAICSNKYASGTEENIRKPVERSADGELPDDVIVISDDEQPICNKKSCKSNANCLNYLGQEKWEDEAKAWDSFLKRSQLGANPASESRNPVIPVGLKNLGATCYANAFLQVWFRHLSFRSGVYACLPSLEQDQRLEDSPIFQLQVTFAALQQSIRKEFNPNKLVESLQLETTEQQDAQEFSKLFLSHLDMEFKKQPTASLRSLVSDQFQGKQVYGTFCKNCHNKSEQIADFLEIEINFQRNARLEDRITAMLSPEELDGTNQYLCSKCESLQDATRYNELRKLPPILHFSLLRFVYNMKTMTRKKFISHETAEDELAYEHGDGGRNIYELRGVLLHKGSSAYHGHYEAQVYDTESGNWFQFNDEVVTKIENLCNSKDTGSDVEILTDNKVADIQGKRQKRKGAARKKRRITVSDDEIEEIPPPISEAKLVSSKDSYMLIYAHKPSHSSPGIPPSFITDEITPPAAASNAVSSLNSAHELLCNDYETRVKGLRQQFEETRRRAMDIYRHWQISSLEETSAVVSRQALERWMDFGAFGELEGRPNDVKDPSSQSNDWKASEKITESPESIVCSHGFLDPLKASAMKRLAMESYNKIAPFLEKFQPLMSTDDVCESCVRAIFEERKYEIEHPKLVAQFETQRDLGDMNGCWISKSWVKDWRLNKPKMHKPSEPDPNPNSPEYASEVRCEHGELSCNPSNRHRISTAATEILKAVFPTWCPMPSTAEPCVLCEVLVNQSKDGKHEIKKTAENEKARLKHMFDALGGLTPFLENIPCAIVPASFTRAWRQWLNRPCEVERPRVVDNSGFICEHGKLLFDLNTSDFDGKFTIIKRSEWDTLKQLYLAGPLIAIEKKAEVIKEIRVTRFEHAIPVCSGCRQKRRTEYEMAEVTVRILSNKARPPLSNLPATPASHSSSGDVWAAPLKATRVYGTVRQSKRLLQVKEFAERRKITISKDMTVKEIKIIVQDELRIPTICQRMFYDGRELVDNSATARTLGILVDDVLDVKEEIEDLDASDSEGIGVENHQAERGFRGTLLGKPTGVGVVGVTSAPNTAESDVPTLAIGLAPGKSCQTCTLINPNNAEQCMVCETAFF